MATKKLEFSITAEEAGTRLDRCLSRLIPGSSRSYLQKLIREGMVRADGAAVDIPRYPVRAGMRIEVDLPEESSPEPSPEPFDFPILYEDDAMLVIDKPAGVVVHPAAGNPAGTVVNALLGRYPQLAEELACGNSRPGIVHRIDMNTTGVLVACKNDYAHRKIAEQLSVHSITRKYEAICYNAFREETGTVDAPIGRNPVDRKKMAIDKKNGRRAVTHYRVLENFKHFAHIECQLETGRTHQIRVHMASIGHPLLGDDTYTAAKPPYRLTGQTLHARVLGFIHPRTGQYVEFEAPLPDYFTKILADLQKKRH